MHENIFFVLVPRQFTTGATIVPDVSKFKKKISSMNQQNDISYNMLYMIPTHSRPKGKKSWSAEEDEKLLQLVEQYGGVNWALIAEGLTNRTAKQCRERYHNHLQPSVRKGEWTEEEDELIVRMQAQLGNQWAKITKMLPGRTDNAVKNRWHAAIRALSRNEKSSFDTSTRRPNVPKLKLSDLKRYGTDSDDTSCNNSNSGDSDDGMPNTSFYSAAAAHEKKRPIDMVYDIDNSIAHDHSHSHAPSSTRSDFDVSISELYTKIVSARRTITPSVEYGETSSARSIISVISIDFDNDLPEWITNQFPMDQIKWMEDNDDFDFDLLIFTPRTARSPGKPVPILKRAKSCSNGNNIEIDTIG
eukprot:gene6322-12796_t